MKLYFPVIFSVFLLYYIDTQAKILPPSNLRVAYQDQPLGIDIALPRFSWEVHGDEPGVMQTAYQILVGSSKEKLQADQGDIWDSGKIRSDQNINVVYNGSPLPSFTRYFWKVKIWDQHDTASSYSKTNWFETAFLEEDAWQAQWIGDGRQAPDKAEDFYKEIPVPIFRKAFQADQQIVKARLYITGLGYYEAYLNGKKVGDHVLDPGWTNYGKRVLYSTYDVTDHLRQGENAFGVMLGNGWYNPLPLGLFRTYNLRKYLTIGLPKFIAELHIWYEDDTKEVIRSDQSWKCSTGSILKNNIYLGELYDARLEQPGLARPGLSRLGWKQHDFDDSVWNPVEAVSPPGGQLQAQIAPPIRITQEIEPVAVTEPEPGVYVFDLGQNFAGWIRLKLQGEAGTKVTMRYGELLYDNGHVNGMTAVAGHIKEIWNLSGGPGAPATAYQEDVYIMKGGEEEEVFQQKFGFHAFRYVEVSGYSDKLTKDDLTGLRLNADLQDVGQFTCSDSLLNEIQRITEWSMLSNVFSIQSDCPGREKFGYGGDIVVAGEAYIYNFDMANFYTKTVRDFQDDARPNGGLPETAPFNGIDTEGFGQGTGPIGWQLAHPFIVKQLYAYYGDKRIVEEQYQTAVNLIAFLQTQDQDYYINHGIGDHESLSYKAVPLTSTAFYYHIARLVADFAEILGKKDDARKYKTLASHIKEAFMQRFYHAETGVLDTAITQANQAFGLFYDLIPQEDQRKVLDVLVKNIEQTHQGHLSTGIFSTKMMWDVLDQYDRNDVAYAMITQKGFPGYAHMIDNGATTLWESWKQPDQNSWNHPMFGSVSEWFYQSLLGIQQAPDGVGFNKILIKPSPVGDLKWAKGHYQSIRGKIAVEWKKEEGQWKCHVEIPGNTVATLALPVWDYHEPEILSGGKLVYANGKASKSKSKLKFIKKDKKRVYFQAVPGTYDLVVK